MPENITQRRDIAQAKENQRNGEVMLTIQGENFSQSEQAIYFYNISQRDFSRPRFPNHPHMFIKACPKGEPFVLARGSIVHPFTEIREDQNENKFPVLTNGFREASKMMNPMNPGLDQDFNVETEFQQGDNLNRFGVFWSKHNPPLAEELDAAKKRMEATYRKELERMSRAKTAEEAIQLRNDISVAAADYFGVSATWHQTDLVSRDHGKVECGACGEKIQPTAKLCKECGAPTDPALQAAWLANKFEKRPVGRPVGS